MSNQTTEQASLRVDALGHAADAVRDACLTILGEVVSFDDSRKIAEAVLCAAFIGTSLKTVEQATVEGVLPITQWTEWARRDDWHQLFVGSDIRQMLGEIARLRATIRTLQAKLVEAALALTKANRTSTDRLYMLEATANMLGPNGRKMWSLWQEKGIERVHYSWGPEASKMTGEELADVMLRCEEAAQSAVPIDESLNTIRKGDE
jgi:hypothetical protein